MESANTMAQHQKESQKQREFRIEICNAFKRMTLAHIQRLTVSSASTKPDEIRAVRECVETIMKSAI